MYFFFFKHKSADEMRISHWSSDVCSSDLITGLNYVFGKRLLMPLIGPDAFSAWSQWAKYAHNFIAWPFMLGVLIMLVVWVKDNLPDRYDGPWLKAGGGVFDRSNSTRSEERRVGKEGGSTW